jgi:heme exporter protein A
VSDGALLRFTEVTCERGGRILFDRLSLNLAPGEALLVTGANGVGKSSLIRLAAGLLRPSRGSVERSADAALVDEALALDGKLTVGAALGFWAHLDGGNAAAGMESMGLSLLSDIPVRMLSTGQRKRAALARVVASRAPLWLLDEPANGLDAEGLERLAAAVAAHRAAGGAVLAASHQPLPIGEHRVLAL